jgi:hypothetical protein
MFALFSRTGRETQQQKLHKEIEMNTETHTAKNPQNIFNEEESHRNYRPRLSFYHANGKGTGSAAQFEVVPASGDRSGAIYLTLAQQNRVSGIDEQGKRQYATFDWQNRVTVKLNFSDLCQMLMVFRGLTSSIADGKGLYHDSRNMTTIINLSRQSEPYTGVALELSRKSKTESDSAVRVRIIFNDAEAFGVGAVLEQSLGVIAFGIPEEAVYSPVRAPLETEQPAI